MSEYKLLSTFSIWGLERDAKKLLDQGYLPAGGVSKGWGKYLQAFYRIAPSTIK